MNEIKIFNNNQFGEIRTATTETGDPLFCLTDLCAALKLTNNRKVKSQLDDDVTLSYPIVDSLGRNQDATFVTEAGMYTVILRSDSPLAKPMQKWVTSEVLPAIRKTGGYIVTKEEDTPEIIMARALIVANDTMERMKSMLEAKTQQLAIQAPKALFADAVCTSTQSCLVGELSKILKQNGIEMGQNRLFDWLRKHDYLCQFGERYNQPTQKSMELELFDIKKTTINKPDGTILISTTTKVTGKGQIYFVNKFLKTNKEEAA